MKNNKQKRPFILYFVIIILIISNAIFVSSYITQQKMQEDDYKKFLVGFCSEFFYHFSDRLINEMDTDMVTADEVFARWISLTRAAGIWDRAAPTRLNSNYGIVGENLGRLDYTFWEFWNRLKRDGELTAEQHTLLLKIKVALSELQASVFIEGANGDLRPECFVGTYFVDQFLIFFEQIYDEI